MAKKRQTKKVQNSHLWIGAIVLLILLGFAYFTYSAKASGYDQYGYNDRARAFSGKADGVDKNLDGKVWGDPLYASDHLVMKWNKAWDDCNDHGNNDPNYCKGAWTTNQWNGMAKSGSQSNWHYKIIWVGSAGQSSPYWVDGGYLIWGNYEVIADHGTDINGHQVYAKGVPNGLGR